jgi:hypothetical protein
MVQYQQARRSLSFTVFWCKKCGLWSAAHSLLHNNPGNKGESTLITGRGQGERKTIEVLQEKNREQENNYINKTMQTKN